MTGTGDRGLALSEERLAEINRRRKTPLEDMVPHEEMLAMLEERRAAEAGEEFQGTASEEGSS